MKWVFPFVATLLASLPSMASVNGQTVRGTLLQNANEFLVAILFRDSGQDWRFICTGSLIHNNFVITAGHCLQFTGEYAVRFFNWDNGSLKPADLLVAKELDLHPDWIKSGGMNAARDIGLIMIPNAPEWTNPIPFPDYIWEPKWGDGAAVLSFDRDLSVSTTEIKGISRINLSISSTGTRESSWSGKVLQNVNSKFATALCGGDSGAPIIKVRNGQFFLAGLALAIQPVFNKPVGTRDGKLIYMRDTRCGNTLTFKLAAEEVLERWMGYFPGVDNPRVLRIH